MFIRRKSRSAYGEKENKKKKDGRSMKRKRDRKKAKLSKKCFIFNLIPLSGSLIAEVFTVRRRRKEGKNQIKRRT